MLSSDNYTMITEIDGEPLVMTSGSIVSPEQIYNNYILENVEVKDGFTFNGSLGTQSVEILPDGSTTVKLYFTRDRVDLYVVVGTGLESAGVVYAGTNITYVGSEENGEHYTVLHGDSVTLTATSKAGYNDATFTSGDVEITNKTFTMPLNEQMRVTVNASATPKTDTIYTIEVYLADELGAYKETATYETEGKGTTDEAIPTSDAQSIIEEEFDLATYHYNEFKYGQNAESEDVTTILGDGSSVIKFYYLRNEYKVTYEVTYADSIDALPVGSEVVFGKTVEATFTMQAGYTFDSVIATRKVPGEQESELKDEVLEDFVTATPVEEGSLTYKITFTMPAYEVNIKINTTANTDTAYTVVYHYEKVTLNNEYDEGETVDKEGTTGTVITEEMIGMVDGTIASPKEGFEYSRNDLIDNTQIAGDGSTVVNVYFNRIRKQMQVSYTDDNMGLSNLQVKVNGVVVDGNEAEEGSSGVIITTRTYSIAYGQSVEVSFDLAEFFEFDGFEVTGLNKAQTEDEPLKVGEYRENGTVVNYVHGLEDVKISITVTAIEVNYTVKYFTQNVVPYEEANDQVVENYSEEAVFEATGSALINNNLTADFIKQTYIDAISSLPNYNEEIFVGMNIASYWYKATNSSEEDITGFITVASDGSTVINIYINRQIIDINLNLDDNFADTEDNIKYVYGDEVTINVSTEPGYDFVALKVNGTPVESGYEVVEGENNEEIVSYSFTISEENIMLDEETKAYKIDVEMTSVAGEADYTINIYLENIELNGTSNVYGEPTAHTLSGTTGTAINYEDYLTAPEGYNLLNVKFDSEVNEEDQPLINGDESSVINIYFNLQVIYFEIELTEGVESFSVSSRYGSLQDNGADGLVHSYMAKYGEILQSFNAVFKGGFTYRGISLSFRGEDNEWTEGEIQQDSLTLSSYSYSVPAKEFKMILTTEASDIIIYYDPNDGSAGVSEEHFYGDLVTIRDTMFEKDGYTFLGWALSPEQAELGEEGVAYRAGETLTITNSITLYAVWEKATPNNWWIYLVIGLCILLLIIIIIIIIIVTRKKKKTEKQKMAAI